jgi:hypothetical protein
LIVMPGLVPHVHRNGKAYAAVRGWPGRARPWLYGKTAQGAHQMS